MANRVIEKLDLTNHPYFNPQVAGKEEKSPAKSLLAGFASFVRADQEQEQISVLDEDAQTQLRAHNILNAVKSRLTVSPVRNSEMIEISFVSPDPVLTASLTNAAMDEFIQMQMDTSLEASKTAGQFLAKQIRASQIKLEESELELNEFGKKLGIVSLNPDHNLVIKQLEEVNSTLAKASSDRIAKEAMFKQNMQLDEKSLEQIVNNELIKNLKNQYSTLEAEYTDLGVTFKADYPKMRQLKAKMDEISSRIEQGKAADHRFDQKQL